eukprot:CAMPEP_0176228754 /NCGR_PEP_ID=MMETSP0121_2-20121125/23439_1 /TAXON_ID=160619 /ORGANISM="Kryptoperidinium foliaceum, Strain CCMP 1326" /LENGTH=261 /DNA_ID=CAMNT_0017568061 /DNA_START=53 /DNA_END=839 /DNA_ORIENTATION=+
MTACVASATGGGTTAGPLRCPEVQCPRGYTCETRGEGSMICSWNPASITYVSTVYWATTPASTTPYIFTPGTQEEASGSNTTLIVLIGVGSGLCAVCFLIGLLFCSMTCTRKARDAKGMGATTSLDVKMQGLGLGALERGDRDKGASHRVERRHGEQCHSDFVRHEVHEHHTSDRHGPHDAALAHRMAAHHEATNEREHHEKRTKHHRRARDLAEAPRAQRGAAMGARARMPAEGHARAARAAAREAADMKRKTTAPEAQE